MTNLGKRLLECVIEENHLDHFIASLLLAKLHVNLCKQRYLYNFQRGRVNLIR